MINLNEIQAQNQPFDVIDSFDIYDVSGKNFVNGIVYTGTEYWSIAYTSRDSIFIIRPNGTLKDKIFLNVVSSSGIKSIGWDGENIFVSDNNLLYKIDTNTKSIISQVPIDKQIRTMTYDPSADNGNGGFWNTVTANGTPIYLINKFGQLIDSIPFSNIQLPVINIVFDSIFDGTPHLIINHWGPPSTNVLEWYDLNSNTFSDTTYILNTNCRFPGALYLTNELNSNSLFPQLIVVDRNVQDSMSELKVYNYGVPPGYSPSVNDDICDAIPINIDSGKVYFDNLKSTSEINEPIGTCFSSNLDSTVWLKMLVTNPSIRIQNKIELNPSPDCGHSSRNDFAVYQSITGNCSGPFSEIACGVNGPWGFFKRATLNGQTLGDTLFIQVDGTHKPDYFALEAWSIPSISRDFEYYDESKFIALYDDEWFLDSGYAQANPGQDALVSNEQSQSGNYSLKIDSTSKPVYYLYDLDSSSHVIGFSAHIPFGEEAYFEIRDTDSSQILDVEFGANNLALMSLDSTGFIYPNNQWFDVEFFIDLANNEMQLWINQNFVSFHLLPTSNGFPSFNAFVFDPSHSGNTSNEFYIDDMVNGFSLMPSIPGSQLEDFNLISPSDQSTVVIDSNVVYNNVFEWENSIVQVGGNTDFDLIFSYDSAGIMTDILKISGLADTTFILTENLADSIYTNLTAAPIDTLDIFWEVKAETQFDIKTSENGPFEFRMYRGEYVGLENSIEIPDFKLYPNPAKDRLYISTKSNSYQLRILDIQGKKQGRYLLNSSSEIELNHLESGIYLIQIISDNQIYHQKLIVD